MRCVISLVLAFFVLSACGGGGSGGIASKTPTPVVIDKPPVVDEKDTATDTDTDTDTEVERLPFPYRQSGENGIPAYLLAVPSGSPPADVRHMPIYQDGERLLSGVDQLPNHIGALSVVSERGDIEVRYGGLDDGAGRNSLSAYLTDTMPGAVQRFDRAPTVRFVGEVDDPMFINRVLDAIRFINAALPHGMKIEVPSSEPVGQVFELQPDTIYVEFVDDISSAGRTWAFPDMENGGIRHSYVKLLKTSQFGNDPYLFGVTLAAHELLHALGLSHVASDFTSIMPSHGGIFGLADQPLSVLHPIDREALRAVYGRLDNGDSPLAFGPWLGSSIHIHGNGPHTGFGVAFRNGYVEPWAYGSIPDTDLSDNTALSGSVSWSGTLLGFTPDASAVSGDAEIGVDLSTLTGLAAFTSLEAWSPRMAPGQAGTGVMWKDGDLVYLISVDGNTFRETGGDEGMLTGVFVGPNHEGATGTLERTDLTAAFGAER